MIALPLNLIFYILLTLIGFILLIKTDFLGRIIATFLFAFLATWISGTSILNIEIWYISSYNSTSGVFGLTHTITTITTPLNIVLITVNIALSLANAIMLYKGRQIQRDNA